MLECQMNMHSVSGYYERKKILDTAPEKFSMYKMIYDGEVSSKKRPAGKCALYTKFVAATFLHWPSVMTAEVKYLRNDTNFVFHLRNWSFNRKVRLFKNFLRFSLASNSE